MANTRAARKNVKQEARCKLINATRLSSIKTATKKVIAAIKQQASVEQIDTLLRDAVSQLARAKGKNTLHANTVSRRISRLSKKVAAHQKAQA